MDQVALLTALLLMSILDQGAYSDQDKRLVAEVPFEKGETQIEREEQTSKLYDASKAVQAARKNADVRVIIEGYFDGQADTDNTRRGVARAAATKRWLQTVGGLRDVVMDDRLGPSGENKRVAKVLIEGRSVATGPRSDESHVVKDIEFRRNSSQVPNNESLLDAWYEIRSDVQQKGVARLVIEGDAAPNEKNAMAEDRATVVKHWFDARQPIPNLQLSTRTGQENKSVVRLIIEREQRRTSR
jgi:hypothetical protein